MAHSKKKKSSKKSRGTVLRNEALGIRRTLLPVPEAMRRLYRATVAWLRRLAAVLRRAGAAVASNAALRGLISATADSATRLTPSPATPPPLTGANTSASTPPPLTGAENRASTPPPLTGSENRASTPPPPTGAENRTSTPPPLTGANNLASTRPPPTSAKNDASGSQASSSASAPAFKSGDSAAATSSPPTGARSGSQASGSAPGLASKAGDSAPRLETKPATLPPPRGAKTTPSAGNEADGFAQNRGLNQNDSFSDGYHLNSLFEEDESFVVEEDALIYARFCSERATSLLKKKEICHICFFRYGDVVPFKKEELEDHCQSRHSKKCGFVCKKQGCLIRTSSLKEAGRHYYFCHEMYRDWWIECLKLHGET